MAYTFSDDELKKFTFEQNEVMKMMNEDSDRFNEYMRLFRKHYASLPEEETDENYNKIKEDPNLLKFWKTQTSFIRTLSEDDIDILKKYLFGGQELIEKLIQNKDATSIFSQNNFKDLVYNGKPIVNAQDYLEKFTNIFQKLPLVETPFKVYKGVRGEPELTINNSLYLRLSLDREQSINDTIDNRRNPSKKCSCCLLNIIIEPGVHASYILGHVLVGQPFVATIKKNESSVGSKMQEYDVVISPREEGRPRSNATIDSSIFDGGATRKRKRNAKKTHRKKPAFMNRKKK
jgi:hypothetical protein